MSDVTEETYRGRAIRCTVRPSKPSRPYWTSTVTVEGLDGFGRMSTLEPTRAVVAKAMQSARDQIDAALGPT